MTRRHIPLTKCTLLNIPRLRTARVAPVLGHCSPSRLPTAWRYNTRSRQIRNNCVDPVPASLFVFCEGIFLSSISSDQVCDGLDRGRANSGERYSLDGVLCRCVILGGNIDFFSQSVRTISRRHVESDRATVWVFQKSSPVIGRRVSIFIALVIGIHVSIGINLSHFPSSRSAYLLATIGSLACPSMRAKWGEWIPWSFETRRAEYLKILCKERIKCCWRQHPAVHILYLQMSTDKRQLPPRVEA